MVFTDNDGELVVEKDVRTDIGIDDQRIVTQYHVKTLFLQHLEQSLHGVAGNLKFYTRVLFHELHHGLLEQRQKRIGRTQYQFSSFQPFHVTDTVDTGIGSRNGVFGTWKEGQSDIR